MAEKAVRSISETILLVEDEGSLADSIRYNLEREGFTVLVAEDGHRALERFRADEPSLVILDLMLPGIAGLDVCRAIRSVSDVPIVILTAKDSEADKVTGLELGADDYVTKPFSVRELVSRVRAHLRRARMGPGTERVLRAGNVEMDVDRHEVKIGGEIVDLPPKEFELLELFMRQKGRLLTREFLIRQVWGPNYFGDTKTLDVHVKRIRSKIEPDPHEPRTLLTVRGLGYKLVD